MAAPYGMRGNDLSEEKQMPLSLQAKMDRIPNLVDYFRNLSGGNSPSAFPVVPAEFSNWRDEQRAWLESVVLLDQTHHMYYEYMRGKDILKLLNKVAANSFRSFEVDRGKQIVCCSPDGYLIGDGILFHLEEEEVMCVGRAIVPNWLRYNAEVEGYDIEFKREARSPSLSMGREVRRSVYRYQIQGPKAADLITKLNGGRPVDLKFFHMGHMTIAGRAVRALRHGMAGVPGLEIWGPFDEWEEVRAAILEAGKEFGIVPVGNKGYSSATFGSGSATATSSSSTTTSSGATRSSGWISRRSGARLRSSGTLTTWAGSSRPTSRPSNCPTSGSTCRAPTTPRTTTTRSCITGGRSGCRCSPATISTIAPCCRSASSVPRPRTTARSRSSGASRMAERPSLPSRRTGRSRFAPR